MSGLRNEDRVMHVEVVLAKDVMNALQKVSPEADRAGQIHSSPHSPTKKVYGSSYQSLRTTLVKKDFLPSQINLLSENTSHE